MSAIIKVSDISKQYRLGQVGTGTISHDLNRWWHAIRGKENPYLKIGEENDRSKKGGSDYAWALQSVNFDVRQGQVLGIIGRNGAGKSTLLKILSRTTAPTTGKIRIKGRVASLLEVGTGFHPELSGRENVFLNGAILGMSRSEIKRKFDEIVDFSGVERYIDTPVKRYSSGMYVRLAFAVAAHLESEILIVDEVLAVGDAEFQKKALGKMKDVSTGEGRTVLFVSHNMAAVKSLCEGGIVLENGRVKFIGNATDSVTFYLKGDAESQNCKLFDKQYDNDQFKLREISFNPKGKTPDIVLDEFQEIEMNIKIDIKKNGPRRQITLVLNNEDGDPVFAFTHVSAGIVLHDGYNHLICSLPRGFLNIGTYYLTFYLIEDARESIFVEKDIISFDIHEGGRALGTWLGKEPGYIKPIFDWQNIN